MGNTQIPFLEKKEETNAILFQYHNCTIDVNTIKSELLKLFRSPNPFYVLSNLQSIQQMFGEFLNCIANYITQWFLIEWDKKSLMYRIYKDSWYEKVWMEQGQTYIWDSRYFDVYGYFLYVSYLQKENANLIKTLYFLWKKAEKGYIQEFLQNQKSVFSYEDALEIFERFSFSDIGKELSEPKRKKFDRDMFAFWEYLYLSLASKKWCEIAQEFLDVFFVTKESFRNILFEDAIPIIHRIFTLYPQKKHEYMHIFDRYLPLQQVQSVLDDILDNFLEKKYTFYIEIKELLRDFHLEERKILWKYIHMRMIDRYFPEIKRLYYFYSIEVLYNKDIFSQLKWSLKSSVYFENDTSHELSPEAKSYQEDVMQIVDLKNIILTLYANIFSNFLLPVVYYTISEKITITKSDLWKMKYLILFIFAKDYSEYKRLFFFFNQLEVFLNFEEKNNVLEKIKVSFSYVLLAWCVIVGSYLFLPAWIFFGIFLLIMIKAFEIFHPDLFFRLRWNIGAKFFAYIFLGISWYYWIAHFDVTSQQFEAMKEQFEYFATYPTSKLGGHSLEYVKASIGESIKLICK